MENKPKIRGLTLTAICLAGVVGILSMPLKKESPKDYVPTETRQSVEEFSNQDSLIKKLAVNSDTLFAQYTSSFEGRKNEVYNARPNSSVYEPTIGIGHFLGRGDSRETFAKVLPSVDYDSIINGKSSLTDEQVDKLFASDIVKYVHRAKKLVPKFGSLPVYTQAALVDMAYRGDLAGSPKTLKLINEGKFREAGDEYINSKEYKTAVENKMSGLKTRMDSNRERLMQCSEN